MLLPISAYLEGDRWETIQVGTVAGRRADCAPSILLDLESWAIAPVVEATVDSVAVVERDGVSERQSLV